MVSSRFEELANATSGIVGQRIHMVWKRFILRVALVLLPLVVSVAKVFSHSAGEPLNVQFVGIDLTHQSIGEPNFPPGLGPLKVSPGNPRYFMDANGNTVYLTGSHTGWEMQDDAWGTKIAFDFTAYLDFLIRHNHNFVRLWTVEYTRKSTDAPAILAHPMPYARTGPGNALDGQPKFDLKKLDQSYFDRLRKRVILAGNQGVYVSIMLFDGSNLDAGGWFGHPFNASNNINELNGDPDNSGHGGMTHTLQISDITAIQDAYIKKVIDTVGDLDNVLYEVSNESNYGGPGQDTLWQYHIINLVKSYEADRLKQHPIGMTGQWSNSAGWGISADLYNSPADWISPGNSGDQDFSNDPPYATGVKVILVDTDHLSPRPANSTWVWRSFLRGLNPIYMDDETVFTSHFGRKPFRLTMGDTRTYASKMNLAAMTPQRDISSTGYVLAHRGREYLMYQPGSGSFTATIEPGTYAYEWFNGTTHAIASGGTLIGIGRVQKFTPPFAGHGALYLRAIPG